MSASRTTRAAAGAFAALVLVAAALVAVTGLRVEDIGPVIVGGLTLVGVAVVLLAPPGRSSR